MKPLFQMLSYPLKKENISLDDIKSALQCRPGHSHEAAVAVGAPVELGPLGTRYIIEGLIKNNRYSLKYYRLYLYL